ncbi:MAG TPA: NYN domain-containing protein [Thermoanaerobaculia bacterium]|nr:NYN domain-containing protein [Thermoanaerobaculia bacterium]
MSRKPAFESHEEGGDYGSAPSQRMSESKLALFIDFENIAIGVTDAKYKKFEIALVLERLLEKGKIVVKRAYCDWDRFPDYKRELHEAAIELIEIPGRKYSGKNSADIRMVVDAMDMAWSKDHIDLFVIASGDSDFSPLVSKLKENDKYVIGVGVKNSSSDLLIDNCDEFIFYEDLVRGLAKTPAVSTFKDKKQGEVFKLLIDSIKALMRENKEILWGSMVKQTMQRKKPTFNEEYYGYNTFSDLLEDAQNNNIIKIKKDVKSGSYVITGFAQPAA